LYRRIPLEFYEWVFRPSFVGLVKSIHRLC
jgi:hypothetical protein